MEVDKFHTFSGPAPAMQKVVGITLEENVAPPFIGCTTCLETLTIDGKLLRDLHRHGPGYSLLFECPKCKTRKVITVESRLVIGDYKG